MNIRVFGDVKVSIKSKDILKKNTIYCMTFPNGKRYVGMTTQTLKERLREHIKESFRSGSFELNSQKAIAIRKYMEFGVDVLFESEDKEELKLNEIKYIKELNCINNGYNISIGGGGSNGIPCSQKKKNKISLSNIGKEAHNKMAIAKYDLNGNFICEFDSMSEASKSVTKNLGGSSKISEYLSGKRKYAYGYIWKIVN